MRISAAYVIAMTAVLAGCAEVPVVNEAELATPTAGSPIKVFGARGPLSAECVGVV